MSWKDYTASVGYLYHDEDSGCEEVQGVQTVNKIELESHADEWEEETEVEDAGDPGDRIEN